MNRVTSILLMGLAGFAFSGPVNATVFYIDSFSVYRDGSIFFQDNFDDGVVPPSAGGWVYPSEVVAEYSTVGSPGPESGGKLALDTAQGYAQPSEVTGTALLVQRNRLLTNTNDNPNTGLKLNHDIAVFGVFDFIAPELNNERYSIRLTDFQTDYAANDNVDVTVHRNNDGVLSLAFRQADFDNDVMNVLDEILLTEEDFLDHEQIVLGLFSGPDSTEVYGGYSFLGGPGGNTDFTYFDGVGNIFNGEVWTRAAFIATQQVKIGVPEPASLLLAMIGLVGIAGVRVKKQS